MIVAAAAAGLEAGLGAGEGLVAVADGVVSPQADTITAMKTVAAARKSFDCIWMLLNISEGHIPIPARVTT
jgi:hypothetical protein